MCIPMISNLSEKLKELRILQNLRQEQVAKLVGVNTSAISSYENDRRRPSFEVLVKLASVYHVSTDYLLNRTDDRSISLTGLADDDASLVCALVESLRDKRRV